MRGEDVVVVGGGNSAGQAAVFLASAARRVDMLVAHQGWPRRCHATSSAALRRIPRSFCDQYEIVALEGDGQLARVRWRDVRTGEAETHDIKRLFIMTGAVPNTRWLDGCLALDDKGFVKTGPTCRQKTWRTRNGRSSGPPTCWNEPSAIFAVGDVRGGSMKRVASAVGEGSIAVALVHQALRQYRRHHAYAELTHIDAIGPVKQPNDSSARSAPQDRRGRRRLHLLYLLRSAAARTVATARRPADATKHANAAGRFGLIVSAERGERWLSTAIRTSSFPRGPISPVAPSPTRRRPSVSSHVRWKWTDASRILAWASSMGRL